MKRDEYFETAHNCENTEKSIRPSVALRHRYHNMQTKIEKQRKCSQCVFIAMPIDFQPWTTFLFPSMPKSPFSVLYAVLLSLFYVLASLCCLSFPPPHNPATPSRIVQQTSLQLLVCCCRLVAFFDHTTIFFYSF